MDEDSTIETAAGIEVPAAAAATAAGLAAIVREATRDLPFGVEPAAFLAALEQLAPAEDGKAS